VFPTVGLALEINEEPRPVRLALLMGTGEAQVPTLLLFPHGRVQCGPEREVWSAAFFPGCYGRKEDAHHHAGRPRRREGTPEPGTHVGNEVVLLHLMAGMPWNPGGQGPQQQRAVAAGQPALGRRDAFDEVRLPAFHPFVPTTILCFPAGVSVLAINVPTALRQVVEVLPTFVFKVIADLRQLAAGARNYGLRPHQTGAEDK
jgi:hypothetical protein